VRLFFVGAGGGRRATSLQPKGFGTGGFVVGSMYVDPGPAALYKSRLYGVDVEGLKHLYISHGHLDHIGDGNALAESMNALGRERRAELLAPKDVLGCGVSRYHVAMFREVKELRDGLSFEVDGVRGRVVRVFHSVESYGFVLGKVAYTADTGYRVGLGEALSAKVLIANALWPGKGTRYHLGWKDVVRLTAEGGFEKVLLYHSGYSIYELYVEGKVEGMLREIERETGADVLLVREGMEVVV